MRKKTSLGFQFIPKNTKHGRVSCNIYRVLHTTSLRDLACDLWPVSQKQGPAGYHQNKMMMWEIYSRALGIRVDVHVFEMRLMCCDVLFVYVRDAWCWFVLFSTFSKCSVFSRHNSRSNAPPQYFFLFRLIIWSTAPVTNISQFTLLINLLYFIITHNHSQLWEQSEIDRHYGQALNISLSSNHRTLSVCIRPASFEQSVKIVSMTTSLITEKDQVGVRSRATGTDDDLSGSHPSSIADDSSTNTPRSRSQSSTTGTSLTGTPGINFKNGVPEDIMTSKETRAINYSRCVVLGILVLSATVAGVLMYLLTSNAAQTDFETQVRIRLLILTSVIAWCDAMRCNVDESTNACGATFQHKYPIFGLFSPYGSWTIP